MKILTAIKLAYLWLKISDETYQAKAAYDIIHWRRNKKFNKCLKETAAVGADMVRNDLRQYHQDQLDRLGDADG